MLILHGAELDDICGEEESQKVSHPAGKPIDPPKARRCNALPLDQIPNLSFWAPCKYILEV